LSYKISFKSSVYKDLKKIDKAQTWQILNKIDEELTENPDSFPQLSGKFSGLRKFRAGNYRIICSVLEDTVLILRISHRKDVYR
jgi:mRNA interferase RelE/StbE